MERTMRSVRVLAGLAAKAKENGKEVEFLGYMIGALAESFDALLEHAGDKGDAAATATMTKIAQLVLNDCGDSGLAHPTMQ